MKYYIFFPEKNEWSDIAYTEQELQEYPGINGQTQICEAEGGGAMMLYSQLMATKRSSYFSPYPKAAPSVVSTPDKPKKESSSNNELDERLYTYRLVCIVCRFVIFAVLCAILVPICAIIGAIIAAALSSADAYAYICCTTCGLIGIVISIYITCNIGKKPL